MYHLPPTPSHQIPVLVTKENWCVADSTPMLTLLDAKLPHKRFYPKGIVGALAAVLEEYFDEWSARWCIHTRWMTTEETAQHAAAFMMAERSMPDDARKAAQENVISWGRRAARAIGVNSEIQRAESEKELLRIYSSFDAHLQSAKFVFGNAPTAVDTVIMGGLRAHFLHDLYPSQLLSNFSNVVAWHDAWGGSISESDVVAGNLTVDNLPPFVELLLQEMGAGFKDFVLGMKHARVKKSKAAVITMYGEEVSYLYRPYAEKSRKMLVEKLQTHLGSCSAEEKAEFQKIMSKFGLSELYLPTASL
jgi:glutathione S-transferase